MRTVTPPPHCTSSTHHCCAFIGIQLQVRHVIESLQATETQHTEGELCVIRTACKTVLFQVRYLSSGCLPEKVKIVEVGPRDGLQNEKVTNTLETSKSALAS